MTTFDALLVGGGPAGVSCQAQDVEIGHDHVIVSISGCERVEGSFLVLAGGVTPRTGGVAKRLGLEDE